MASKVSAEDLHKVLPLLYDLRIGEDPGFAPDIDDLYARTKIDRTDLDAELTEQSALYAWWATLLAEAEFHADIAQRQLDVSEANVVTRLRREKSPATIIHDIRKGDSEYVAANEAYITAKRAAAIIRAMVRALEHRREMLVALSYRQKREYEAARDSI